MDIPTPDIAWDMTVACAAPPIPQPKVTTKIISSTTFRMDVVPKKTSGITEFPIDLKR